MKREPPTKPPLGLEPRRIWQEKRLQELQRAIQRFRDAAVAVPREWIEEAYDLFVELTK
jgi:hypothetical protein